MGHQGRFGKYGELKRMERLRADRGTRLQSPLGKGQSKDKLWAPWKGKETGQTVRIRLARPEDCEYIRVLSREAFEPFGDYDGIISAWFEREETVTFIAEKEKRRLGFAMLGVFPEQGLVPRTAELLAIAVMPGNRRRGIGSRLVEEAIASTGKRGVTAIILHTAVENDAARQLFAGFGFRPLETKKGFYPKGQDAVVMYREIGGGS